jgi:hypothetical protein
MNAIPKRYRDLSRKNIAEFSHDEKPRPQRTLPGAGGAQYPFGKEGHMRYG